MKVNFIVEIVKGNKRRVVVESVGEYQNLWHFFDCLYSGRDLEIVAVNYMPSKKKANETADQLNDYYRRQDRLLIEW